MLEEADAKVVAAEQKQIEFAQQELKAFADEYDIKRRDVDKAMKKAPEVYGTRSISVLPKGGMQNLTE